MSSIGLNNRRERRRAASGALCALGVAIGFGAAALGISVLFGILALAVTLAGAEVWVRRVPSDA
jgi:hypothetical protein